MIINLLNIIWEIPKYQKCTFIINLSIILTKEIKNIPAHILPQINDFHKEVEVYYKNKTLTQKVLEKMKDFEDRPCLGRRLKIGENDKGMPIFEKQFSYFTYKEIKDFCYTFSKNLHEKRNELTFKDSYRI